MAVEDLVIQAEAQTFVKAATGDLAKIDTLVTRASQILEALTGRRLKKRVFTDFRFPGPHSRRWDPPAWPIDVASAITIKVDETSQTVWRTEVDGDPALKDVVVGSEAGGADERLGLNSHFWRWAGWESALAWGWEGTGSFRGRVKQPYNVLITYSGGFTTVPEDLKQACLYLVQRLWRDLDKQASGVTSINVGGGSVTIPETGIPKETRELLAPYMAFRGVLAGV